jgi:hypothetical protein
MSFIDFLKKLVGIKSEVKAPKAIVEASIVEVAPLPKLTAKAKKPAAKQPATKPSSDAKKIIKKEK